MCSIGIRIGSSEQEIRLFAAYRLPGPDTPTHVPTDMRHRPDVLDVVIGHKIKRPMHVEVVYGMDTQHLLVLVTVRTGTSNSPPAAPRQRLDWENFEKFLEALYLGILLRDRR
ncbi:hypothetical protein EVAR_45004_1 [Eumeta japonica]|uniref:Uncharacterized protein n=1 Tax=Eumeta variegata TaxID=151549 RepID=A0A4C1XI85_EUMVA|nr:hypothetical protein EVAR_45004_1 [Eumeta japonica]